MRATQPRRFRGGVARCFFFFFFTLNSHLHHRKGSQGIYGCGVVFEISGDLGFRSQRARKHREPIPF